MMKKCLYCYENLVEINSDFHPACSRKIFGQVNPPELPYDENDLESLAQKIVQNSTTVTGVQAKLSLHISKKTKSESASRFTIVGLWGGYILKPPSEHYPELPEVEDLTMHLAKAARIGTAQHSLIRLRSGNLAYITKRMDRDNKRKLAMEDMCQLTDRLTEDKYRGSYEQIAKTILKYSNTPGLDLVNFFELVLFSFLTGNADMHLKNFSLLESPSLGMTLSPAYDLVNTALVNPLDNEDLALTLNGRKKKLKGKDFIAAMQTLKLEDKQQRNILMKLEKSLPMWLTLIEKSFLKEESKQRYREIILERSDRLFDQNR